MKGILFCLSICLMCITVRQASAQVFSVAAGTDFGIKAGTNFVADSMDLVPSADFTLNGNTLTRTKVTNVTTPFLYVTSVYQLATTSQAYSGSVKFNYSNAALNGIATSTLALNIYNGSAWNGFAATSRGNNSVLTSINGVPFNLLTLADLKSTIPTWTGSSSTSWSNASNWYGGLIPTTGSSVYIPAAPANQPVLDANASIGGLELNGSLTLADKTLTLNSSLNGIGTFKGTSTSNLVLNVSVDSLYFDPIMNGANLTIPSGVTAKLGNSITVYDLLLGGTIDLNKYNLSLNGNISGAGVLKSTTASSIYCNGGSGTIYFDASKNNIQNITLNSGTISLGSSLNLCGTFTPTAGTFNTNDLLTLKSTSIASSAVVDQVGATINGNVTVERYIPAGYRAYRDMASEIYGAGTIYNNWQEGGSFTSGKGIFITGASATDANKANYASQPVPNGNGLDYSLNGINSAYTYAYPTFSPITNTKVTLDPFVGYRVLIRGDRSFNLATTPISNIYGAGLLMVNPTTLRSVGGKLITGTVTYNTTNASGTTSDGTAISSSAAALSGSSNAAFSMIANPYVCPVMWGDGTPSSANNTSTVFGNSSHINGSFWYLDPTYSATGTYLAYNALSGFSATGSSNTHIPTGYIQPGQAVFVQNFASTSPVVKFTESTKAASSNKTAVFGKSTPLSKIYIRLYKLNSFINNYNYVDGAAIAFSESFDNIYGPQDAIKFGNANDNLYISDKGKNLSIDGRLPATATDVLPIALSKPSGKNYQLLIDASIYGDSGFLPVLKDNYKGTVKALSTGIDTITFIVDTTNAASYTNRFSLGFKPTTLAVNSIVASATLSNKIATISWNTVGEKGVSTFEVEKSTDAKSFTKIGQATAKNTVSASYSSTDNSVTATTYYRIKAISQVGTVSYSNVVKLSTFDSKLSTYSLYPNPVIAGKTLNISLNNVATGKYIVIITNVLGQKVQESAISHTGGNGSHAITINNALAAGTYSVTVIDASNKSVYQSNLSVKP